MKKSVLLFLLIMLVNIGFSQRLGQSLGRKVFIKLVSTPAIDITPVGKNISVSFYFSENILVNNSFFFGLAGSAKINKIRLESPTEKIIYPLDVYFFGFQMGSYLTSKRKKLEPSISIFTGVGDAAFDVGPKKNHDFFFFASPELTIEQRFTDNSRIILGLYYRLAMNSRNLKPEDLTSVGVRIGIKFDYY